MTPARLAAYRVLRAVSAGDDLPRALARVRNNLTDDRDRALVTEITSGVLRWQASLDHLIARTAGRPTGRLDAEVLTVLRVGTYQLRHLERVPTAAAVNESVTLVRRIGKTSAAGLVNAVLRRIATTEPGEHLPPEPGPTATREVRLDYLSVTCSHPRWLVERWLDRLGFSRTLDWVRFNNRPPAMTLRANRLRITRSDLASLLATHDVRTAETRFASDGLTVLSGNPLRTPLAEQGLFLVQDEASQLVAALTAVRPGETVLDACAAPGGKTTAITAAIGDNGRLVASDLRPARVHLLSSTLAQAGAASVHIIRLDLRQPLPLRAVFDCVLVDAPCSGLGVVRRDPQIRWRRKPADLAQFAHEQRTMVRHAAAVVRPGGRLVYATCSSEPEENEEIIAEFLADHDDFDPIGRQELTAALPARLGAVLDDAGRLVTYPDAHDLEVFFGAVLRRRGSVTGP